MKPHGESQVVHALSHPPHHIVRRRDARHDDHIRERGGDDVVDQNLHAPVHLVHAGHAAREVIDGQPRLPYDAAGKIRTQGLAHLLPFTRTQPVGKVVFVRDVDRDPARVPLPHDVGEEIPLILSPQLGRPTVGGDDRCANGLIQSALRGTPEGQTFDAFVRSTIEEDVDRAATRRKRRW